MCGLLLPLKNPEGLPPIPKPNWIPKMRGKPWSLKTWAISGKLRANVNIVTTPLHSPSDAAKHCSEFMQLCRLVYVLGGATKSKNHVMSPKPRCHAMTIYLFFCHCLIWPSSSYNLIGLSLPLACLRHRYIATCLQLREASDLILSSTNKEAVLILHCCRWILFLVDTISFGLAKNSHLQYV
jgi:hypothetical protein